MQLTCAEYDQMVLQEKNPAYIKADALLHLFCGEDVSVFTQYTNSGVLKCIVRFSDVQSAVPQSMAEELLECGATIFNH